MRSPGHPRWPSREDIQRLLRGIHVRLCRSQLVGGSSRLRVCQLLLRIVQLGLGGNYSLNFIIERVIQVGFSLGLGNSTSFMALYAVQ